MTVKVLENNNICKPDGHVFRVFYCCHCIFIREIINSAIKAKWLCVGCPASSLWSLLDANDLSTVEQGR